MKQLLCALILVATALSGCALSPASGPGDRTGADDFYAWSSVTVSVADLDAAMELWVEIFGFQRVAGSEGPDAELAKLWQINPNEIRRQALVATDDHREGMIHLVEFENPAPAVRDGAAVFDLLPKNLDIYVHDMPARVRELRKRGQQFRTDNFSELAAPDGTRFREIHMPSHDEINVVLLEVLGESKSVSSAGYGGVGPLIYIVPDAAVEKDFVESILHLDKLNDNLLSGPELERMIGLPPGAALDVSIWGHKDRDFGALEIIEYRGVSGTDRYPLARPKARGILHVSYVVDDAGALRQRLADRKVQIAEHGSAETLIAEGQVLSFVTPAGLQIYVYDLPD